MYQYVPLLALKSFNSTTIELLTGDGKYYGEVAGIGIGIFIPILVVIIIIALYLMFGRDRQAAEYSTHEAGE